MSERAPYIVLEGSDGTGKSSQAIRLTDHIETLGYNPLRVFNDETGQMEPVQEPGGTEKANAIRLRLKDKSVERTPWQEVEWLTEARKSIWEELVNPALTAGRPVITARNWISTDVYQGRAQGVPLKDIEQYTREHLGYAYMHPDLICILALKESVRRIRLEEATRSISHDQDIFESRPEEFQLKLQKGYIDFSREHGIKPINATPSRDFVQRNIWKQARQFFELAS